MNLRHILEGGRLFGCLVDYMKFEKIMRGILGALIVASTLQIVPSISGLWRNVARFLSPLSVVPLVALSGFGLYEFGFPVHKEDGEDDTGNAARGNWWQGVIL